MKKSFILLTAAVSVGWFACTEGAKNQQEMESQWITTESGLKYRILRNGNGAAAENGSTVKVHYKGTFTNGDKFDSSYDRGEPIAFKLGAGQVIKGWDEGISYLTVGDSAELEIPSALAYGSAERPGIPANSDLNFTVELVDVVEPVKIEPFDISGVEEKSTESGLKFYVVAETEGEFAQQGQMVQVHYTGYLEDGTIFDSSLNRGEPISFPLGTGRVIKGWDEGLTLLRVGEKSRLVIPSELAYGEQGAGGVIPPNATLIFDVHLVSAK